MAPHAKTVARWALTSLALVASVQSLDLRIMPLGASITFGIGQPGTHGNGYRLELSNQLQAAGFGVDYVGTQINGDMSDPQNEGWPSLRIEEVMSKAQTDVPKFLPSVYTINLGTNDCTQNFNVDSAGQRMNDLITYLYDATPNALVVLSTLIPNTAADGNVVKVNDQFRTLVNNLSGQGKRIVLAEMHESDGPQMSDLTDGTHPTDAGYIKMANIWFRAIGDAADQGLILPPQ